jgi:hypothetical protein
MQDAEGRETVRFGADGLGAKHSGVLDASGRAMADGLAAGAVGMDYGLEIRTIRRMSATT